MKRIRLWIECLATILFLGSNLGVNAQNADSESLGRAISYFQSEKYHEAKIILQRLDKQYRLNPRFQAYLGVCCFYDEDYQGAAHSLEKAIPKLGLFSPHERSFYFFADAESHFNLGLFDQALNLYTQMLSVCHENEKAEAYYKMGLIYCYKRLWINALDCLQDALVCLQKYMPDKTARIAQIRNMIYGCCEHIDGKEAK